MLDHHFCHLPTPHLGPGHRRGFGPDAGVVILHVAGRFILAQWHLSRLGLAGLEAPMVTREFLKQVVGNAGSNSLIVSQSTLRSLPFHGQDFHEHAWDICIQVYF